MKHMIPGLIHNGAFHFHGGTKAGQSVYTSYRMSVFISGTGSAA
jgi:hypothetical protein